jgi:hypothetical protein
MNCLDRPVVSKRVIKVPPVRAGRRVHWRFEVSADVGAENGGARKATRKRRRAMPKKTRASKSHRQPLAPLEFVQDSEAPLTLEGTAAAMTASNDESMEPTTSESADHVAAVAPHETVEPMTEVRTEPVAPIAEVRTQPVVPMTAAPVAQRKPATGRSTPLRSVALAATAFTVLALLAFPRHPASPDTDEGAVVLPAAPVAKAADVAAPAPETAVTPRATAPSKKMLAAKPDAARTAKPAKPAASFAPTTTVAAVPLNEDVAAKLPGSEELPPPPMVSASTGGGGVAPVTITGCLEVSVSQDEYRLTDTEGIDAPKSRSWKTGFLKRRAAPVSLIEPTDRTALRKAVGRRVAATGTLSSHDLKVSALRVVGPSCN